MAKSASIRSTEPPRQLLFTRKQLSEMLGCSAFTLVRLEKGGALVPIKLSGSATGATYYTAQDVEALIAERRAASLRANKNTLSAK